MSTLELKGKVTIEMKLDWIFVKPVRLTDPDDTKQPYVMAPQFGRTLKALNCVTAPNAAHTAKIVNQQSTDCDPRYGF